MWDLPGPGLEPFSPTLAGGFLTTAPPGKPHVICLFDDNHPIGCGGVSDCGLVANDAEHVFMCLLAILISSLEKIYSDLLPII